MPHYKDGTEANVGDLVKGRGYNVPHEIIGRVVNVRPGESCTLSVAYVGIKTKIFFEMCKDKDVGRPFEPCTVVADIEYGDTKGFEKIG